MIKKIYMSIMCFFMVGLLFIIISDICHGFNRAFHKETSTKINTSSAMVKEKREEALTDEEAKALYGTGFHNTRPNSTAESIEIEAARVKCKKCGKHSDNGVNSLCDECQKKHTSNSK